MLRYRSEGNAPKTNDSKARRSWQRRQRRMRSQRGRGFGRFVYASGLANTLFLHKAQRDNAAMHKPEEMLDELRRGRFHLDCIRIDLFRQSDGKSYSGPGYI